MIFRPLFSYIYMLYINDTLIVLLVFCNALFGDPPRLKVCFRFCVGLDGAIALRL